MCWNVGYKRNRVREQHMIKIIKSDLSIELGLYGKGLPDTRGGNGGGSQALAMDAILEYMHGKYNYLKYLHLSIF